MSGLYRYLSAFLFCFDPETSHQLAMNGLKFCYQLGMIKSQLRHMPKAPVNVLGLSFDNPVGLAAGFDKNGDYIDPLLGLGFGFIELGTVTPYAQPGNPKPRIFRLKESDALINRMGFPNQGVHHLVAQIKKRHCQGVLGVNLGKNAATPLDQAYQDYCDSLAIVYPYADYVTINVSSPNTVGLQELQSKHYLKNLLHQLKEKQSALADKHKRTVPLLLKISSDLSTEELTDIAQLTRDYKIAGIIAVNTTKNREAVLGQPFAEEAGGLSGRPLHQTALRCVNFLNEACSGQVPIIAVGGILSAKDAIDFFNAGASLVQIYTGFIYKGPRLLRDIVNAVNQEKE